ncbi:Hypothetical protein (plasmid) [Pseudomonas putida]|nr:Hypothetical protein [Pseudomonas putida]
MLLAAIPQHSLGHPKAILASLPLSSTHGRQALTEPPGYLNISTGAH